MPRTTRDTDPATFWGTAPSWVTTDSARIAYRTLGSGPPLLLIHGWPLSSFSYRKLAPLLAPHFTCYLPDTPGLGETEWTSSTDFNFRGQARTLAAFADQLGLPRYRILAFDTGATIARQLTLNHPDRVEALVLLNTEIPHHRPPFIQLFQRLMRLPGSSAIFRQLLRLPAFYRSPMGFRGCFVNLELIDAEFCAHIIEPLLRSPQRLEGVRQYLWGIDWDLVDSLAVRHGEITAPVQFIWGADDPTFPVALGREMAKQLPNCRGFEEVPGTKLLLHEERPDEVARRAITFLKET